MKWPSWIPWARDPQPIQEDEPSISWDACKAELDNIDTLDELLQWLREFHKAQLVRHARGDLDAWQTEIRIARYAKVRIREVAESVG